MIGPNETSAAQRKLAIADVFSIVSRMETEPLRQWLSQDVVMEFPYACGDIPERLVGLDSVVAAMGATRVSFSSFLLQSTAVFECPSKDCVIVEARSQGIKLDGSLYANRYVIVFRFNGSKIAMWREYFDPLKLGILHKSAAEAAS